MAYLARRFAAGISLLLACLTCSVAFAAFDDCLDQFAGGAPPWVGDEATGGQSMFRDICFNSFAVLHSGNSRTPVYVAMRMDKVRLDDALFQDREGTFYPEARLPVRIHWRHPV